MVENCNHKAKITFQKKFRDYELCWKHGMNSSRQTILEGIGLAKKPASYKQKAKMKAQDDTVISKIMKHKNDLTLENYKDRTGKRFRMTADQVKRGISRQEALEEFLDTV